MPTLHRTIDAASREAAELLDRYKLKHAYVVRHERVYNSVNVDEPGFEALTNKELPPFPNIVATISRYSEIED
jgi:hypothetical protein